MNRSDNSQTLEKTSARDKAFDQARRRAFFQDILAPLRNAPANLLPFEEVREKLRLSSQTYCGLQEVPLDQIVGSVARYHDFSRAFRPRSKSLRPRWRRMLEMQGHIPPIELYQVGEVYFVVDGNHRVSVARQAGAKTITAHVWAYETRVPVESNDDLNDIWIRQEYLEFLQQSHLDVNRPEQRIVFTVPGRYRQLGEEIARYREWMDRQHIYTVSFEEAAAYWYDTVYVPMAKVIREKNMLAHFPGRTEADLVAYILRYRDDLRRRWVKAFPGPAVSLVNEGADKGMDSPDDALPRPDQVAREFAKASHQQWWHRLVAWFKRRILGWEILDRRSGTDRS